MIGELVPNIAIAIIIIAIERESLKEAKARREDETERRAERDRHIAEMEEELGLPSLRGNIDWGLNYIMETYGKDKWKCPDVR